MLGGLFCGCGIDRSHKLGVELDLLQHANMLAAHRAIDHGSTGSLGNCARSPDSHCAVDDGQCRSEILDVARGLAGEILDLERVADMHHIDLVDPSDRGDIHAEHLMVLGNELEQRPTYLTESDDYDLFV